MKPRLPTLAVFAVLAALVAPDTAWAHAALYDYKFPLPLWVFLLGAQSSCSHPPRLRRSLYGFAGTGRAATSIA